MQNVASLSRRSPREPQVLIPSSALETLPATRRPDGKLPTGHITLDRWRPPEAESPGSAATDPEHILSSLHFPPATLYLHGDPSTPAGIGADVTRKRDSAMPHAVRSRAPVVFLILSLVALPVIAGEQRTHLPKDRDRGLLVALWQTLSDLIPNVVQLGPELDPLVGADQGNDSEGDLGPSLDPLG